MIFARRTAAADLRFRDLRFPIRFLWKWDPSKSAPASNMSLMGSIDDKNRFLFLAKFGFRVLSMPGNTSPVTYLGA